jgi:hypothetical protein
MGVRKLKRPLPMQNQGRACLVCPSEAHAKGYCRLHYVRWKATGVAYLEHKANPNWKNIGKTCSTTGCPSTAAVRGLCTKHYHRFRRGLPEQDKDFFVNKGKACSECSIPAHCRGLCRYHYTKWRLTLPVQQLSSAAGQGTVLGILPN